MICALTLSYTAFAIWEAKKRLQIRRYRRYCSPSDRLDLLRRQVDVRGTDGLVRVLRAGLGLVVAGGLGIVALPVASRINVFAAAMASSEMRSESVRM